jgi:hypothetical protein
MQQLLPFNYTYLKFKRFQIATSLLLLFVFFGINAFAFNKNANISKFSLSKVSSASLKFDGTDDHVQAVAKMDLTGSFTIEAWVKPATTYGINTFFSSRPGGNFFDVKLLGGNKITADIGDGNNWLSTNASVAYNYTANTWLHVAYVITTTGYTIYINGNEVGTGTYNGTPLLFKKDQTVIIGSMSDNSEFFNGNIDELRIWNTARSATEIKNNLCPKSVGSNANLVAYYSFDDGESERDNSTKQIIVNAAGNTYLDYGTLTHFALTGTNSNFMEEVTTPQTTANITVASSNTIIYGTSVTFTATSVFTGANPTYQWYLNNSIVSGATLATYTSTSLVNEDQVHCVMTAPNNPCVAAQVTSNIVTMSVADLVGVNMNQPANQEVNQGAQTTAVTFTSAVSGVTYDWTNNTTSIGLAASGSGNIASFVANSTSNAAVKATITVTPKVTVAADVIDVSYPGSNSSTSNRGGQSFIAVSNTITGAGFKLASGGTITIELWAPSDDSLLGTKLASGSVTVASASWADVFWSPVTVTPGAQYVLIFPNRGAAVLGSSESDIGGNDYYPDGFGLMHFPLDGHYRKIVSAIVDYTFRVYKPGATAGAPKTFTITVNPPCDVPVDITTAGIGNNKATVNWTNTGTFDVKWGTQLFTDGNELGTANGISASSYEITGLAAATTYDVYVRKNCGSTQGNWVKHTFTTTAAPATLYVNAAATTNGIGDSWAAAYQTLKEALDIANANASVTTINVAAGTYYPTGAQTGTDRNATFALTRSNLKIYGGYNATNGTRNLATNPTILSGDIGTLNNDTDNSSNVMVIAGIDASTDSLVVDGFTITGGNANVFAARNINGKEVFQFGGAGIYIIENAGNNIALHNCIISGNTTNNIGGGVYSKSSSPILTNCVINGNNADYGGGMFNVSSSPRLTNVIISGNSAINEGGGLYNWDYSSLTISNGVISGNSANRGGGLYNRDYSSPTLTNVTISGNTDVFGGGAISNSISNPQIRNTIIYGNSSGINNDSSTPAITYSLVQGIAADASKNILDGTIDPLFVSPQTAGLSSAGDYRLQSTSPAINKGNNADIPTGITTDLDGNKRIQGNTVDLGAYESGIMTFNPDNNILYVDKNVSGGTSNGNSWANAIPELADALLWAQQNQSHRTASNPLKILVASGTYKPAYNAADGQNTTDGGRDNAFVLSKNVQIYGGFNPANNIVVLTDKRVFGVNGTTLSGDLGIQGNDADNAYHVVISAGDLETTLVDGVTITGGRAENPGGVKITVNGEYVYRNSGAGFYNIGAKNTLRNVHVTNNYSDGHGAGIYNDGSSSNQQRSHLVVTNSVISINQGDGEGSFTCSGATAVYLNTNFIENRGAAAQDAQNSTTEVYNSIWYNNGVGTSSCTNSTKIGTVKNSVVVSIAGIASEMSHVRDEPTNIMFERADISYNDLFILSATNPVVNNGSNTAYTINGGDLANDKDFAGNNRVYAGLTIDIGAYEFQGNPPTLPVTLLGYTAKANGNHAQLQWQTTNEVNNLQFLVYRKSEDGEFVKIGTVAANTNTQLSTISYSFTDKAPLNGNNYYKLVQVDYDGKATDLGVRTLNFSLSALEALVYPNPTKHKVYFNLKLTGAYTIYNNLGQKVMQGDAASFGDGLDVSNLGVGVYHILVAGKSYKIVKQ